MGSSTATARSSRHPATSWSSGLVESPKANLLWIDLYDPSGPFVARSTASPGRAQVTATTIIPGVYTLRVRNNSASPIDYKVTLLKGLPW
jgi:hypothetical protein